MALRNFISAPRHTVERERLLHLKAALELRLHAAKFGSRILVSEPEIDVEGFDFTLSSEFESLCIQSKGTLKSSGARSWQIRAALIKPSFYNRDLMPDLDGYKVGGYSLGGTGGILLHIIDDDAATSDVFDVSYRYLDIYWLIGVASGVAGKSLKMRKRALQLLRDIRAADDDQVIQLRLSDFAKLKSLPVLAMLRLHVGFRSNWASSCHAGGDLAELGEPGDFALAWEAIRGLID